MKRLWFSSDLHFGHANIIKYCSRPYASVEEMDEALVANWNAVVAPEDRVILLGDIFFCQADRAKQIMRRLHGRKELVLGNHDKMIRNQKPVQDTFSQIHPDLYQETLDGILVVMSHYPLLTWNRAHRGSFMLHGHSHGKIAFDPAYRRLDVGVDPNGYAPISWDSIKAKLEAVVPNDVRD